LIDGLVKIDQNTSGNTPENVVTVDFNAPDSSAALAA